MGFFILRHEVLSVRKVDPELNERLATLISSMGYELVGCEKVAAGRLILRIYIDSPKGVNVEDCSKVSRQVSAMLDVNDSFQGKYTLEVSSPGIDRPLFEIAHYRKQIGKRVNVHLALPVNQRRNFKGLLQRVEGEDIYLKLDDTDQELKLSLNNIDKGNLISEF